MRPVCGPTGLQLQDFSTAGAHNNTFTLEKAVKREYIDNVNKKRYTEYNRTRGVVIMANTNINIRMDTDLKKQFEAFCADMGMTMTTALIFLRERLCGSIEYLLRSAVMRRTLKPSKRSRK